MQVNIHTEPEINYDPIDQVIQEVFKEQEGSKRADRLREDSGFIPGLPLVALVEKHVLVTSCFLKVGLTPVVVKLNH